MRIGNGYDVHRFAKGRKLYLGGVEIENNGTGLLGHSDADVLIHALMDAMLGAAGLRDIGYYFSDKDEKFKGIRSTELLKETVKLIAAEGFTLSNADMIIVAEEPKISPYIEKMKQNLADLTGVSPKQLGVKATTEEGMGFTGRKEGMAAYAVVLLAEI